jgi:hypothetical protein
MSEIAPVTEEKKESEGLLSQITNAFSTNSPGVGPEIGDVPPSEPAPAVVSTSTEPSVTEASVDTTEVPTSEVSDETDVEEPMSMPESATMSMPESATTSTLDESAAEGSAPVLAPLDATTTGTKKKRKKKRCKCPTKKQRKLPKCKRGSQRSKKTKKCKSKKKCAKGTRRDPATGVCQPK